MSFYLNKKYDKFVSYYNDNIFVDKSMLLSITNSNLNVERKKYMCVTRPRRFGKSMALSMLNAYYSKGCESSNIFDELKISKDPSYLTHLNKHNVIYIDMFSIYTTVKNKNDFFKELVTNFLDDINEAYPNVLKDIDNTIGKAIIRINSRLNERFIFLIDEWDVIYREKGNDKKLCEEYTDFLRNLFKSADISSCIDLVYMTGILPIKRYSTESSMNMFKEYNMLDAGELYSYYGFTEEETRNLCTKYNRNFNEIKQWYNGYKLNGVDIYNPKSVVDSICSGSCKDYWVQTSATEGVVKYMRYDHGVLKDTIIKMLSGENIFVEVNDFQNDLTQINSKDSALVVLVHLGYLAYIPTDVLGKGYCYIPNYEIRCEFKQAFRTLKWKDIYNPIFNSDALYEETLKGNTKFINETFDKNHLDLAGPFNKNKEDVLGIIVQISYYRTKEFYNIKKEDTSTLGRADLTFIPYDNTHIPLIVELKVNSTPTEAISQIKSKEYYNSLGEYHGDVLLLGISYNDKTLKHDSKIEIIKL